MYRLKRYPKKHLRDLCKSLGEKYSVRVIDLEFCIYRKEHNIDFEIRNLNTSNLDKRATIHVWALTDEGRPIEVIETIKGVEQSEIGNVCDAMVAKYVK